MIMIIMIMIIMIMIMVMIIMVMIIMVIIIVVIPTPTPTPIEYTRRPRPSPRTRACAGSPPGRVRRAGGDRPITKPSPLGHRLSDAILWLLLGQVRLSTDECDAAIAFTK